MKNNNNNHNYENDNYISSINVSENNLKHSVNLLDNLTVADSKENIGNDNKNYK